MLDHIMKICKAYSLGKSVGVWSDKHGFIELDPNEILAYISYEDAYLLRIKEDVNLIKKIAVAYSKGQTIVILSKLHGLIPLESDDILAVIAEGDADLLCIKEEMENGNE